MVGRICPTGGDKVRVCKNLGATTVAPVAPADTSLSVMYYSLIYKFISTAGAILHMPNQPTDLMQPKPNSFLKFQEDSISTTSNATLFSLQCFDTYAFFILKRLKNLEINLQR